MELESREFLTSPPPSAAPMARTGRAAHRSLYEVHTPPSSPVSVESLPSKSTEEYRRLLLDEDISDARKQGLWICRLWQLLLTLNLVILATMIILILLLLFIIGPLAPYRSYGQSCRSVSCNAAFGLVCGRDSTCRCPSNDSYWSWKETGCRRCPSGWSLLNGKCLFVSTFNLNWADASSYCRSFTAQLFTLSAAKLFSSITLSQLKSLVSINTNYFLGLSEQPVDSGNWQWVDGNPVDSSTLNSFCANGAVNQLDPIFRTTMNCGLFRMDACLARYTCERADINFICEKM